MNVKHYSLKLGMKGANQGEIMQLLKTNGADVIQTSDGLCVKASQTKEELESLLGDGLQIEELKLSSSELSEQSKDVQAFLGQ